MTVMTFGSMFVFCAVLGLCVCGCNSRYERPAEAETMSAALALDAVKAICRNDSNALERCTTDPAFDPTLRGHIWRLMSRQDTSNAVGLLNQHVDLWVVGRTADARVGPFPSTNDDSVALSLVRNVAIFRREHPWTQPDEHVRNVIEEALARATNLPSAPKTCIRGTR